jgi:hypothetical protein
MTENIVGFCLRRVASLPNCFVMAQAESAVRLAHDLQNADW